MLCLEDPLLCLGRSLCVPPVCEALQEEQNLVLSDENECVRRCGPLNISLAVDACRAESHTAIKTVRIPQIKDLRALIEDPKLNLKVKKLCWIHLKENCIHSQALWTNRFITAASKINHYCFNI